MGSGNFKELLREKDVILLPGTLNALVAKLIEAKDLMQFIVQGRAYDVPLGLPNIGSFLCVK